MLESVNLASFLSVVWTGNPLFYHILKRRFYLRATFPPTRVGCTPVGCGGDRMHTL